MTEDADKGAQAPTGLAKLDRDCIRTRVRKLLLSRIIDGAYPSGFHLKELSLASEFRVSQAPVREALRELETMGLVVTEPYRGSRVRGIDLEELLEAYELRATMESRAVELAMLAAGGPLPESVCAELSASLELMRSAVSVADKDLHIQSAFAFHRKLIECCGNRVFLRTWDGFHWDLRATVLLRSREVGVESLLQVVQCHEALLGRLHEGDMAGARVAVRTAFDNFVALFRAGS